MNKKYFSIITIALFLFFLTTKTYSYSFTDFASSEYLGGDFVSLSAMQANLGISDLEIEDFDDTNFINGLEIVGGKGLVAVEPLQWGADGTGVFQILSSHNVPTVMNIAGGTDVFGLGFTRSLEYIADGINKFENELIINGTEIITLNPSTVPNFNFLIDQRNGYLKIEADSGDDPIYSIGFRTTNANIDDGFGIDYVAIQPVPEPETYAMLLAGLGLIGFMVRRSKEAAM